MTTHQFGGLNALSGGAGPPRTTTPNFWGKKQTPSRGKQVHKTANPSGMSIQQAVGAQQPRYSPGKPQGANMVPAASYMAPQPPQGPPHGQVTYGQPAAMQAYHPQPVAYHPQPAPQQAQYHPQPVAPIQYQQTPGQAYQQPYQPNYGHMAPAPYRQKNWAEMLWDLAATAMEGMLGAAGWVFALFFQQKRIPRFGDLPTYQDAPYYMQGGR